MVVPPGRKNSYSINRRRWLRLPPFYFLSSRNFANLRLIPYCSGVGPGYPVLMMFRVRAGVIGSKLFP